MSATAAAFLAIGLALAVAGVVAWKAKTQHQAHTPRHAVPLRAEDAADHITPGRLGDDDQWRRWRTLVPHIRREANAERDAAQSSEEN